MTKPAMTPQQEFLTSEGKGALSLYRDMAVGKASLAHFVGYEMSMLLLTNLPGALGLAARSTIYPLLFRRCGKRPAIGRGVILRGPAKLSLGNRVVVDDLAVLDARGDNAELIMGDYVSIGRFTTLAAKGGIIQLGAAVNIGSYSRIATQSRVEIGGSTLVAAFCYIGPGNHQHGDSSSPLISRPMDIKGGVRIGKHVWIGAHSTILDGVSIGDGAIVGAHSLVREDVPEGAMVAGVPARIIGKSDLAQAAAHSGN